MLGDVCLVLEKSKIFLCDLEQVPQIQQIQRFNYYHLSQDLSFNVPFIVQACCEAAAGAGMLNPVPLP